MKADLDLSKSFKLNDRSLFALAHGCPNLIKLNITASDKALNTIGHNCRQLQSLNLGWCENVGDVEIWRKFQSSEIPCQREPPNRLQHQLTGSWRARYKKNGAPSYLSAMIRHFYPDLSASLGVGLQYDRKEKLRFNGLLWFNIKGRFLTK
ncbi:F-box protein SKP2A [Camellia lanceoleosa]|uniref:F-box protein SKP2A n=1 Tax=Camellia lanceoleosa TaxID=1840588 RepID=A0ACC0HE36_9ERIC|nr:F-box protein SKP2A [Camellia lanceoleosa]